MIAVTVPPKADDPPGTEAKIQIASHNWQDIMRVAEGKVTREHMALFDQFTMRDADRTQKGSLYRAKQAVGLRLVTKTINGKVVHVLEESLGLGYHTADLKTTAENVKKVEGGFGSILSQTIASMQLRESTARMTFDTKRAAGAAAKNGITMEDDFKGLRATIAENYGGAGAKIPQLSNQEAEKSSHDSLKAHGSKLEGISGEGAVHTVSEPTSQVSEGKPVEDFAFKPMIV